MAGSKTVAETVLHPRTLNNHIVEGDSANHQLRIEVLDQPGAGGANHQYRIAARYRKGDKAAPLRGRLDDQTIHIQSDGSYELTLERICFQNGPIKEFGVNGVTQEALLAIVIDRLRSFQSGPFACADNEEALSHCEAALDCLQRRTRARITRGVEGTHQA